MYQFAYSFLVLGLSLVAHYSQATLIDWGLAPSYSYALPIFLFGVFWLYQGAIIYSRANVKLLYGLTNQSLSGLGKAVWFGTFSLVSIILFLSAMSRVHS